MNNFKSPKLVLDDHLTDMLEYGEIDYHQYIKAIETLNKAPQGHDLHYYSSLVNEAWEGK